MTSRAALLTLLLCAAGPALAQPIYRCGSSYSQTPCANGQIIQADDARSASQKQQADEATRRDAALARSLEKDRLAQEKQAAAERHAASHQAPAPHPAASAPDKTAAPSNETARIKPRHLAKDKGKSKDFVAEVPGTRTRLTAPKKPSKTPDADPS